VRAEIVRDRERSEVIAMTHQPVTTVILIRHGERDDLQPADPDFSDPHLNEAGQARAQHLIHVVGQSGIKAIYTSSFVRTQEMADPLAQHLGLSTIQKDDAPEIKHNILSQHIGQTVLIIGHSNSVPELIMQLGGEDVPVIGEKEFDNLFIVTVFGSEKVSVTKLKYGDQSSSVATE